MRNDSLKTKLIILREGFVLLVCCLCILAGGSHASAVNEKPQYSQEEYEAQYDNAVGLAELLRTSPDMLHNKLYTAEQEVELQALVDSVCGSAGTDREKVGNILACIFQKLEPGKCYGLNGWDTLCDGESDMVDTAGKTVGPKKAVNEQVYCYTFYDVCRLAGIPCFILEDDFTNALEEQYIAMVYIESASGTGKEWHFVDVAEEQLLLSSRTDVYEELGTTFYPQSLVLDYDNMCYFRNSIFLKRVVRREGKDAPLLAYDSATNTVKAWFSFTGVLAAGEQYQMTTTYIGEDGEAPSGWMETKDYSSDSVTTYRSYAVCGVFLRGRVTIEGKEYELQREDGKDSFYSLIPYYDHQAVGSEPESEEHKAFVLAYKRELEDKAVSYANAMIADKNYIWDDTYFESEEDEKLLKDAVGTALDWDYITEDARGETAFQTAGIPFKPLAEQEPGEMTDKAKAQAVLLYIKKEIKTVDHGANFVNSATVLKQKEGTCEGHSRLYRDMCVMAGVPCFQLHSSPGMWLGDALYGDHAHNMIRVGDGWMFCDAMASGVIGKNECYPIGFFEGYDTANRTEIRIDREAVRKDNYCKWAVVGGHTLDYFEFDSEGKLGIYQRNWSGEPVVSSETDENGKYIIENGLHTVDVPEMNEDRSAEIVTRYAYYRQNLRTLQGKKIIDGKEYDFSTSVGKVSAKCHKLQEVSRRYVISKLTFQPLADQPYDPDGVCPVPEIYHGDKKLEYGKDFEIVEYKHNKELTTYADASYRIEGIGDYMGEATRYFKIVKADISEREVKLSKTSVSWSPDVESRKPKVDLGLTSQNYSVAYYDYDKIGTARVVITGKGNYQGSVTKEYDIKPGVWNAEEFMITDVNGKPLQSQKFDYKFSPVTVQARVSWQDEKGRTHILSESSDYELSYSSTEHPGTVTVTATAKGNYQGTLTCTYEIMPYFLWEDAIEAEYTQTVYNGTVQKPAVLINGFVEGKDYFISYEKKLNDVYQEVEPKDAGEYRIVVRVSEDFAIRKENSPEEEASKVCYISYTIADDGSSGSGGSGTGGGGSGTGSSGGSGSGAGSSGTSTGGSGVGTGSSTGGNNAGTGSSGGSSAGTGGENIAGGGETGISDSSMTIDNTSSRIKKVKLTTKKKAIKMSWSKVKKAKGYQIQISPYKNFKKAKMVNVKNSKTSYTFKKLKKKTKYYIRIRVYMGTAGKGKNIKKVYGKWKLVSKKTK